MRLTSGFNNMSVRKKILLPGLTSLIVLMVAMTVYWAHKFDESIYSAFEERVRLTNSYVSAPLSTAAWNYDSDLADHTLTSLSDLEAFVFAQVLSGGEVLSEISINDEIAESWLSVASQMIEGNIQRVDDESISYFRQVLIIEEEHAGDLIWALDTSLIQNKIRNTQITATVIGGVFFTLFAGMLILISNGVSRPISRIITHISALQKNNTTHEIPEAERKDEIGALGKALLAFRDKNAEALKMQNAKEEADQAQRDVVKTFSEALSKLSSGELSSKIETEFPSEYEKLRNDFNSLVDRLSETMASVIDTTDSIQNGSAEISQASDDLARRTESQAATLEETAAALDELTASVRQAAEGATSVANTMEEAKNEAVGSGKIVNDAVNAMTEIEKSSTHISQIIGVIDDIAFQTNLLALNAGVEAARAGEAGRGFAVVASEVRALAQRSSDAAMEIKKLIGDSSQQVEQGVDLVGKTGEALHSIVEQVTQISGLISEIAQGASEQSSGLGEVNTGMVELDQVTQQNAAMVEEATAASHMLKANASSLAEMVSYFKINGSAKIAQESTLKIVNVPAENKPEQIPSAHGDDWETENFSPPQAAASSGGKIWEDF